MGAIRSGCLLTATTENLRDIRKIEIEDGDITINGLTLTDVRIESGVIIAQGQQRIDLRNVTFEFLEEG